MFNSISFFALFSRDKLFFFEHSLIILKEVSPIIGMGTTEITVGTNFFIPTYFFENFAKQLANGRPAAQIQKDLQDDLGYSEDQAKRAIEQMLGG